MEKHVDELFNKFNTNLLTMAALTEESIHKSVEALKSRNKVLAQQVIEEDKAIDDLENTIQEEAIELLALSQPMASNLRFITTGMSLNNQLERIADLAVNISQRAMDLAELPLLKSLVEIPKLSEIAKRNVKRAIDAFVKHDEALAKEVIFSDKEANQLRTLIIQELIYDYMVKDGKTAPRAVPLLLVARDLERICDHAANIAEDVIYMIQAKVVKHHIKELT